MEDNQNNQNRFSSKHQQIHNKNASNSNKERLSKAFQNFHLNNQGFVYSPKGILQQIESIILRGYQQKEGTEKKTIMELADFWGQQFQLCYLYENEDVISDNNLPFYTTWMLTAKVLEKVKKFIYDLTYKKLQANTAYEGLQKIRDYIADAEQLKFVYGRDLLTKKYGMFSYQRAQIKQSETKYLQKIYQIAEKQDIQFILKLFSFLAKIDVIKLQGHKPLVINQFMQKLSNIKREQQRVMLVQNYSCIHYRQYQQLAGKDSTQFDMKITKLLPNYMFYRNKNKIRRGKMDLKEMHDKFEDYHFLQQQHDYIQWMFPNHYGSNFNSSSSPLNYIESQLFLKDQIVAIQLFRSVIIFFDFMGIQINPQNFKLELKRRARLSDVILVCQHNHLRIMRILACLSVTGFRQIALKLIDFLDKYTSKGQFLQKERRQFEKNWQIYGQKHEKKAKQMCFLQTQQFPKKNDVWKQILQMNINNNIQIKKPKGIQVISKQEAHASHEI